MSRLVLRSRRGGCGRGGGWVLFLGLRRETGRRGLVGTSCAILVDFVLLNDGLGWLIPIEVLLLSAEMDGNGKDE